MKKTPPSTSILWGCLLALAACGAGAPRPTGADASGSGMTIKDGVPVPIDDGPSASVALSQSGKVRMTGLVDAKKLWTWVKWVGAAVAAGGGLTALIRAVVDAFR